MERISKVDVRLEGTQWAFLCSVRKAIDQVKERTIQRTECTLPLLIFLKSNVLKGIKSHLNKKEKGNGIKIQLKILAKQMREKLTFAPLLI